MLAKSRSQLVDASNDLNNAIIIMQASDKLLETKPCAPHEDATFTVDHAGQAALTPAQDKLQGEGARHSNREFGTHGGDLVPRLAWRLYFIGWRFVMTRLVLGNMVV